MNTEIWNIDHANWSLTLNVKWTEYRFRLFDFRKTEVFSLIKIIRLWTLKTQDFKMILYHMAMEKIHILFLITKFESYTWPRTLKLFRICESRNKI